MGQKWEFRNELSHLQPIDFQRRAQKIQWGKNSLFSTQAWTTGYSHKQEWRWNPFPVAYTKRSRCAPQIQTQDWRLGKFRLWGLKPESTRWVTTKIQVSTLMTVVLCLRLLRLASVSNRCWGDSIEAESAWQTISHLPFNLSILKVGESRHWYKRLERNGFAVGITFPKECKSRGIPWGLPWHLQKCQPKIKESSRY